MSKAAPITAKRFKGITIPRKSHPAIRKVTRQSDAPTLHGNKFWNSSCLLIDYLHRNPPEHCSSVIDVGCGWGLGGIWCAKKLGAQVTSADADPNVFPYLQAAAALNGVSTHHRVARFERLSKRELSAFDMLIAADICFWDDLVDPVFNMINRAVKAGVKQILVADPERAPFFEVAQRSMDRHCAELVEWETSGSIDASGAILVIHNA